MSRTEYTIIKLRISKSCTGLSINSANPIADDILNYILPFICSASAKDIDKINNSEVVHLCVGHPRPAIEYAELKFLTVGKLSLLPNLFNRVLYSAYVETLYAKKNAEAEALDYTASYAFSDYPVSQVVVCIDKDKELELQPTLFPPRKLECKQIDWFTHKGWKVLEQVEEKLTLIKFRKANLVIYSDRI
jgi:hypothetical protein